MELILIVPVFLSAQCLPISVLSPIETIYHAVDLVSIGMPRQQHPRNFGRKLHYLRVENDLTLQELSRILGYSTHSHISALEQGKKVPTVELVLKVANLFGVSTDALIQDELELTDQNYSQRLREGC